MGSDDELLERLARLGRRTTSCFTAEFRALLELSVAAASTHLDSFGIDRALDAAIASGTTDERIAAVVGAVSTMGIHAATTGAPIALEVLHARELELPESTVDRRRLREDFEALRGGWHPIWDAVLEFDPQLLADYMSVSEVVWADDGPLRRWEQELVCVAFDVATHHLYEPGIRLHVDGALSAGASVEMVAETIAIAAASGRSAADHVAAAMRRRSKRRA